MDRVLVSIASVLFVVTWTAIIILFVQPDDGEYLKVKAHQETIPFTIHDKDSATLYVLTELKHDQTKTLGQMVNKRDGQGVSIDDLLEQLNLNDDPEAAPNS
ncbi:hypothetical protein [Piscibacillus halophilus]|uniref:Uncharacterized protein n=1 Tax=Piscibacillus halophilus TaxID=571933 RepID=A0A1H9FM89_9BACI|nr:hypothetical protein [Piscibacillus halophilus]SEQ39024.1 hypothetical protein SAMN05216362_11267 [Piscibacillus halophilus]